MTTPGFLARETDELNPETILSTARSLGFSGLKVWKEAAEHVDLLKSAAEKRTITLNYNDFYWTNLDLSRREGKDMDAIIFDYHLLGVGIRYSDVRNVCSPPSDRAARAFREAYGHIDHGRRY